MKFSNFLNVAKVWGLVLGTLSSGHIYDTQGFTTLSTTTAVLTFLSFGKYHLVQKRTSNQFVSVVFLFVEPDPPSTRRPPKRLLLLPGVIYNRLVNLSHANLSYRIHLVIFLVAFDLAFTLLLSRFVFILRSMYRVGTVILGYYVGCQYMVKFICEVFLPYLLKPVKDRQSLFRVTAVICSSCLSCFSFAPNLTIYMFVFLFWLVSYSILNMLMEQDVFELKQDPSLFEAVETLKVIVNILGPIGFSFLTYNYGRGAVVVLHGFGVVIYVYLLCGWLR